MNKLSTPVAEWASGKNDPVMLDLETLGTGSNSVIIAIGAVKFDPSTMTCGDVYYEVVDRVSCEHIGLEVDPETVEWWSKQSVEARAAFNEPGETIITALSRLNAFVGKDATVWGNGADFDLSITVNAMRKAGLKPSWPFWNHRCYRTMKNMFPSVKIKRSGTHHNAIDDAKSQAYHLMDILERMRG